MNDIEKANNLLVKESIALDTLSKETLILMIEGQQERIENLEKALLSVRIKDNTDVWFKSWLNDNICCGTVIGYEYENGGYVIACEDSLISAENVYLTREQAENELGVKNENNN